MPEQAGAFVERNCFMDRCQMNRMGSYSNRNNVCTNQGQTGRSRDKTIYHHVDQMPPAMAYVPFQNMTETFDLCYALKVGTIFPQLCKPFCGRRCR